MQKHIFFFLVITFLTVSTAFSQQFKTHKVKEGETVSSIARLYELKVADILRLNPEIKNGKIRPNTILVIPTNAKKPEAQETLETEITLSQDVTFKQHKVRRKETLFSISKRYGISEEDIKRYNKELYSRLLKRGERIRIPKFKEKKVAENLQDTIPEGLEPYIVKPKQGKWRIAYEHGITIKELESINPGMSEVLGDGEVILVPSLQPEIKNEVIDSLYNYYTVKPKEGFFRLKLKLGLTEAQIRSLNTNLQNNELLKAGMIIKIPKETKGDFEVRDGLVLEKFSLLDSIKTDSELNIAMLMPFRLNNVEFDSVEQVRKQVINDRFLSRSLDFYAGAQMALDSVKQLGISVNLNVYDSENNLNAIDVILADENFKTSDAVIGPFYSKPFNRTSESLSVSNIPVFAPFSKNIDLKNNVFQTIPSDAVLYDKLISYLDSRVEGKNLIVIADSLSLNTRDSLLSRYPNARMLNPLQNRTRMDELIPALDFEKENWVIVETKSISFLANVTSVLNSSRRIMVDKENEFGEKIKNDDNEVVKEEKEVMIRMFSSNKPAALNANGNIISNVDLSNLKFLFPSVNKSSSITSGFYSSYRRVYGRLPSRFAIRGFDLTMDVVLRLAYKRNLYEGVNKVSETEYLENKFNYKSEVSGGYINQATYLNYYDDIEIKLVKEKDDNIESNL